MTPSRGTFLVLVRKVHAIEGATVGSWLYAVAHRLAVRARSDARRRAEREGTAARQRTEVVPPEPSWRDAVAVLHEELDRLPEAYRRVLLLCYLRGLSREEAAAELGRSPGAVKGQLERGRKMLAARLTRRGIGLSAGLLGAVTGNSAGAGGPPPGLVELTVRAATGAPSPAVIALARGAIPMLNVTRPALACTAVGLAALVGLALWRADPPAAPAPAGKSTPAPAVEKPAALDGRWRCVGTLTDGKPVPAGLVARPATVEIERGRMTAPPVFDETASFSLPAVPANAIDIRVTVAGGEVVLRGVYTLEGDALKFRLPLERPDDPRPTGFETRPGDGTTVFVLERIKPGEVRPEPVEERLGTILWEARHGKLAPAESERLAARCLRLAGDHPGTQQAVVALMWALANAPDGPSGKAALESLKGGGIARADLDTLATCTGVSRGNIGPGDIPDHINRELAPLLLARVRRTPDHPKAAAVLSSVCDYASGAEDQVSPVFDEAAQMIATRWTTSPDLTHFLETLARHRQRPWVGRYEAVVRAIATQTPDHYMRYRAGFTLAQLVAELGEGRQAEARELYVRFVADCKPSLVDPSVTGLVEEMGEQARRELDALLVRGIGGPAPDLKGVDLDGRPIALGDYRGKVVLLSFWGSWCAPCMRLIPHERALAERFKDRPFALVGVNADDPDKLDRTLLEKHGITWRSFQNERPNRKSISSEWNLTGYPELYLIDHTGTIRRRWSGAPPTDELDHEVARWIAAAEGKRLAPALPPRVGAAPAEGTKGVPPKFVDKVHADDKGGEAKYVVCVPEGYDGKTPLPVVLFLHGSGQVGADNKKQLEIGLGPAIRRSGMPFPFVGVFPQAKDGPWRAGSPDGERALAILAAVEREYATDPRRVYLTGVSMGGEGVWSLAAAHPTRFAAIVPVCGGGNPKHAAALKDVPCWAFRGDADTVVPVCATRDAVRAVTEAGGRPLYQEYRGVDHNCWDRVYAEAEMYHWLRAQVLK